MKQIKFLVVSIFFAPILFIGCKNSSNSEVTSPEKTELTDAEDEWVSIWNGKDLTGWNTYFNSPFSGFDKTQKGYLGLNNPKQDVITVVQFEDGNVIRISGTAFGMMSTEQDYGNYHLKLKVKWGKDKHVPKENSPMGSGLLYHGFGEPGSSYAWMNSQEMQIMEGYMGDYIAIGDNEILNEDELKDVRPDADRVHSDGFHFLNIKDNRTMILIMFEKEESFVI